MIVNCQENLNGGKSKQMSIIRLSLPGHINILFFCYCYMPEPQKQPTTGAHKQTVLESKIWSPRVGHIFLCPHKPTHKARYVHLCNYSWTPTCRNHLTSHQRTLQPLPILCLLSWFCMGIMEFLTMNTRMQLIIRLYSVQIAKILLYVYYCFRKAWRNK